MGAGRAREVARRPLLRRHGDDLAAELEDGARAARRQRSSAHELRALLEARPQLLEIGRRADAQALALPGPGVEQVDPASLLEGDPRAFGAALGARGQHREVGERSELTHLAAGAIEREQVDLAGAIGPEVDAVADPHRVDVVRSIRGLRHLRHRLRGEVVEPDARGGAAAILLPLLVDLGQRLIGDGAAIGSVGRVEPVGDRQARREAAGDRHGEELKVAAGVDRARRVEEDRLAVGREALDVVTPRVPGQPARCAAVDRHDVDVDVAVVLAAERHQTAVGREARPVLVPFVAGEPPCGARHVGRTGAEVGDPDVVVVSERDLARRESRLRQHARVVEVDRRRVRRVERRRQGQGGGRCTQGRAGIAIRSQSLESSQS